MNDTWERRLRNLGSVCDTACAPGNADANDYMLGMANGLRLAISIMTDTSPEYLKRPAKFSDKSSYTFDAYQEDAARTAVYPGYSETFVNHDMRPDLALSYLGLKLCGEAGEVAEQIAKAYRDDNGHFTEMRRQNIYKECGDVLWYISELARQFGWQLSHVADGNREKLQDRDRRGVIKGSGSDR